MLILIIIGFIAALFTFSVIVAVLLEIIPKWLGIMPKHKYNADGTDIEESRIQKVLGWIYFIIVGPIAFVLGVGWALMVNDYVVNL